MSNLTLPPLDPSAAAFVDLLPDAGKVVIFQALMRSLPPNAEPDYVVYNVGYTDRLCDDDRMNRIWAYMHKYEMESEILYIRNHEEEDPYFKAYRHVESDPGTPLIEHSEARAVYQALRPVTRRGIVVKLRDMPLAFVHAVMKCRHCACLGPDPYRFTTTYFMLNGAVKSVATLSFDTESG